MKEEEKEGGTEGEREEGRRGEGQGEIAKRLSMTK